MIRAWLAARSADVSYGLLLLPQAGSWRSWGARYRECGVKAGVRLRFLDPHNALTVRRGSPWRRPMADGTSCTDSGAGAR